MTCWQQIISGSKKLEVVLRVHIGYWRHSLVLRVDVVNSGRVNVFMLKYLQGLINIVRHGNIDITFGVVPI